MWHFKWSLQEESRKSHLVKYFTFGFVENSFVEAVWHQTTDYRTLSVWEGLWKLDENQTMFTSWSTVTDLNALFSREGNRYIDRNNERGAGHDNSVFAVGLDKRLSPKLIRRMLKYIKENITTLQPCNLCSTWSKVVSVGAQHSLQKLINHFQKSGCI